MDQSIDEKGYISIYLCESTIQAIIWLGIM
jgi:hypothetical protein